MEKLAETLSQNSILITCARHVYITPMADCSVPLNVFEDVALIIPCSYLEGQCCMVAL